MNKMVSIVAGVCVLLLTGAGLVMYLIAAPAKAAAANLAAINSLTVGQTTEAELLQRHQFQKLDRHCSEADCLYWMIEGNNLLSGLHLARPLVLTTMVRVRDGIVDEVSVRAWRRGMPGLSLNQVMKLSCDPGPCVKKLIPPTRILMGTRIEFANQSEIRNHLPEAINTKCLSRLHGCATDLELMPILKDITTASR